MKIIIADVNGGMGGGKCGVSMQSPFNIANLTL